MLLKAMDPIQTQSSRGAFHPGYNLHDFNINGGTMNNNYFAGPVSQDYRCQGGLHEVISKNLETAQNSGLENNNQQQHCFTNPKHYQHWT